MSVIADNGVRNFECYAKSEIHWQKTKKKENYVYVILINLKDPV